MDIDPNVLYNHVVSDVAASLGISERYALDSESLDSLAPEVSPRVVASFMLTQSLLKKFEPETVDVERSSAALRLFAEMNAKCASYDFGTSVSGLSLAGYETHERVVDILYNELIAWDGLKFTWRDLFRHGRFGPGASARVSGTSEFQKLSGTLSCTHPWLYQQWLADTQKYELETWCEIERQSSGGLVSADDASKLSCVPKNAKIDRTICSEPSLNMFYQQGLASVLSRLLRSRFDVDLDKQQSVNRHLARVGSVTGRYSTIDLKSASDLISTTLVEALFPQEFFEVLRLLRCSNTILPSGERVELAMISSMGNAFTFPLMTLIYSAIVKSAYAVHGIPYRGASAHAPTFGVNGDDLVVDIRAHNTVCELLTCYGFIVNDEKTYASGLFRESCGGDYFNGHYVRGVYCKRLRTKQDCASIYNRLNTWSARWNIPLRSTCGYLYKALQSSGRVHLVPRWDQDTAGIKIPWEPKSFRLFHGGERNFGSIAYHRWAERPKRQKVDDIDRHSTVSRNYTRNGVVRRVSCYGEADVSPGRFDNLFVLLSIKQALRSGKYDIRLDVVRYESRIAISPGWDLWYDPQWRDLSIPAVGRSIWNQMTLVNLGLR